MIAFVSTRRTKAIIRLRPEITVKKNVVRLSDDEREQLATLIKPQVTQTGLASRGRLD